MADVNTVTASSPATETPVFEVPSDPVARQEWRQTGKLPEPTPEKAEAKPKIEAPAPSAESAAADEAAENLAPAPEAGHSQEPRKARGNAETRLSELLSDLKRAGLTPAELKTFKRQAQAAAAGETPADPPPAKASEKPTNYADWRKEFKPKTWLEEFFQKNPNSLYEDGVAAMNDHMNEVRDDYREAEQRQAETTKRISEQLDGAKQRYPEADKTIIPTAEVIARDADIPAAVKSMLNSSPVFMDLVYAIGIDPAALKDFVETSKTDPPAAVRKLILLERLVMEELDGKASGKATPRDEKGKFAPEKPEKTAAPEKKVTEAPAIGTEVSGRGAAPPDEIESAVKNGDFRGFREKANRRDLASRRG